MARLTGVRTSAVTVETIGTRRLTVVAPGSDTAAPRIVLITVIITVPASTTAAAIQTSLSSLLNSAAAATEALGIKVVAVPIVSIPSSPSPPPPSQLPDYAELALDVTPAAEHVNSTVTFIGGAAAAVALLALLLFASRSAPRVALATPLVGAWSIAPCSSRPHLTL